MIRAVAWDVDGTLIDSEPAHHAALMRVSARYGVALAPDDPRFVGVAMEDVYEALAARYPAGLTQQHWLDEIVADYVANAWRLKPLPGAREAVAALAKAGVRQCAVSNSVRRVVAANLALLDVALDFAIAREDVARGKPDPEPYALACRRLQSAPEQTLAIEDSETGAASARAAGLPVWRVDPAGDVFARLVEYAAQWTPLATPWMK